MKSYESKYSKAFLTSFILYKYFGQACLQQDITLSVFLDISAMLYFTCCKQNQFLFLSSLILVNMINIPHLSTLRYIKALRITKKNPSEF